MTLFLEPDTRVSSVADSKFRKSPPATAGSSCVWGAVVSKAWLVCATRSWVLAAKKMSNDRNLWMALGG